MITEQDLQAAIADCQAQKNPNVNTCLKLAAFLTIKDHLYKEETPRYSYAAKPTTQVESEFSRLVAGREWEEIFPVIDELMDTLKILNPRLYAGVLRKLG